MAHRFTAALQHANVGVHETEVWNWSATHSSGPNAIVLAPEDKRGVQQTLRYLSEQKDRFRLIGSGNSPNGSFLQRIMLSVENLKKIEDSECERVRVEAGATVGELLESLERSNATLENFSSITSQQVGGWTQVAAHGTGASLPTVDDMVEELTLMTPSGIHTVLTREHPWFSFATVGLGYLGVVTELVLRTSAQRHLRETTTVMSHAAVRQGHLARLREYRHVRYMWIPLTKYCVVVTSNVCEAPLENVVTLEGDIDAVRARGLGVRSTTTNWAVLREELLRENVLDCDHVRRVNEAEVDYWRGVNGRVGPTNALLGFECGGQQLVLEQCFKVSLPLQDVDFVLDLLQRLEAEGIAAPGPIEQRWTSGSPGCLSPAHGDKNELFSWVGIIMYLCDDTRKEDIKEAFENYARIAAEVGRLHVAVPHWAKLDYGINWKPFLWRRYGSLLDDFDVIRADCDPDQLLGVPPWRFF